MLANLLDQGHDLKAFCSEVVDHMRNLLVVQSCPAAVDLRGLVEASEEDLKQLSTDAKRLDNLNSFKSYWPSSRKPKIH